METSHRGNEYAQPQGYAHPHGNPQPHGYGQAPQSWQPAQPVGHPGYGLATAGRKFPTAVEIVASVVILLGFVVKAVSSSWSSINGEVVSFSYIDYGALFAGLIAAGLGIASLVRVKRVRLDRRRLQIVVGIAILLLGGLHLARGTGAFAQPPSRSSIADQFKASVARGPVVDVEEMNAHELQQLSDREQMRLLE